VFGGLLIGSAAGSAMCLQTRAGRDVVHQQAANVGPREINIYQLFRAKFGAHWEPRKPACGVYNCFGHVFADRRTAIYDESDTEIAKIIADDGYRRIGQDERPQLDDIALYRQRDTRTLLHAARIVRKTTLNPLLITRIPLPVWPHEYYAVSKWSDATGEDIHRIDDIPYAQQGFDIEIEIWTDRI
jgi:hypothetical protein